MAGPSPYPAPLISDDDDSEEGFWRIQHELPALAVATAPKPMPYVELLVASPAGKLVVHFCHGHVPGADVDEKYNRSHPEVLSLCAASAAFADIAPDVRSIVTPGGVVFFASTHALHVTVAAADPTFPVPILASLARLAVAFLAACLSSNLVTTLVARPHFDLAPHFAPFRPHLDALLSRALAHPLPYASLFPLSLPCPIAPSSRGDIVDILRSALAHSPGLATHALLLTASPPFPRKLIAVASPSAAPLTPLDMLILSSLPPADTTSIATDTAVNSRSPLPSRIFLQSTAHAQPSVVSVSAVDLRLNPDDYDRFQTAVGGRDWRPEWGPGGGDVMWVIVVARFVVPSSPSSSVPPVESGLVQSQKAAAICGAAIKASLDTSRATRDLIVAMERPWMVNDIPALAGDRERLAAVHGIVIMSRDRMSVTIGASDHELGAAFTNALLSQRSNPGRRTGSKRAHVESNIDHDDDVEGERRRAGSIEDSGIWHVADRFRGFKIFGCGSVTMAALSLSTPHDSALALFTDYILPWTKRYRRSLVPEFDRAVLQPRTPLGDIFAPFSS
jgi:hypothetical protein